MNAEYIKLIKQSQEQMRTIVQNLYPHIKQVRQIIENYNEDLKELNEYEEQKSGNLNIIHNNKLTLIEKLQLLPKYDIDILNGMILIEDALRCKLNTTEHGIRLWQKLAQKYEKEVEALCPTKDGEYILRIWQWCGMQDAQTYLFNIVKHEIRNTQDSIPHQLYIQNITIQDLDKIYSFIQQLV